MARIGAHFPAAVPLPGMSERGLPERRAVEPVDRRMWRWPETMAHALNRRCQLRVFGVPHHGAERGMRGSAACRSSSG